MEHLDTQQTTAYRDLELNREDELKMQLILHIHSSYVLWSPTDTELVNTEPSLLWEV